MRSDLEMDLETRSDHIPATNILIFTGVVEAGTGLMLLLFPLTVLHLLLGVSSAAAETLLTARLAGAAILSLGGFCWFARRALIPSASRGILTTVLSYDLLAAMLLVYGGLALNLTGIALWPAAAAHAVLAAWCVTILSRYR